MRIKWPRQAAWAKIDRIAWECEDMGIEYNTALVVTVLMFDAVNYCWKPASERDDKERYITAEAVSDVIEFMRRVGEPLEPGPNYLDYDTWPVHKQFNRVKDKIDMRNTDWIDPPPPFTSDSGIEHHLAFNHWWDRKMNLVAILREIRRAQDTRDRESTSGGRWVARSRPGW